MQGKDAGLPIQGRHSIDLESGSYQDCHAQRILLAYNSEEPSTLPLVENARAALKDARLDYESVDVGEVSQLPILEPYSCVLVCAENLRGLGSQDCSDLIAYVDQGGGLVILRRSWHLELARLFGIEPSETKPKNLKSSEGNGGLSFVSDTFPAFFGCMQTAEQLAGHAPLNIKPSEGAHIFAANERGFPVGWLNCAGSGRVIYWNSAFLHKKRMRGMIIQSVAAAQQVSVLPIANVAVIQIDDFPAPLFHENMDPVSKEFPNLDSAAFYTQVWHPDMRNLAAKHDLTYTYFPTFNYNDKIAPPFPFDEWTHQKIVVDDAEQPACIFNARAAKDAGELGLHGYNHMSLAADVWTSPQAMRDALREVAARWEEDTQAGLPTSYVPPNNEYDEQGITALSAAFPTIDVISGCYLGVEPERGGQREFGQETWNPNLFCIPRATSGYEFTGDMKFDALSQIGTSGIWTHFVHADDVFEHPAGEEADPYCRNPQRRPWRTFEGQRGLLDEFESWISEFRSLFPWLRFVSTCDAHALIQGHLQREAKVVINRSHATVETTPGSHFQIRLNDARRVRTSKISGATVLSVDRAEGCAIYTVLANASTVIVPFEEGGWIAGIFAATQKAWASMVRLKPSDREKVS